MMLEHSFDEIAGVWNVRLVGEVDAYNAEELKLELGILQEKKQASVVLDCADLTFIDSTGLGALVSVLKKLQTQGHSVHIRRLRPHIAKVFELTALSSIFKIEGE